MSYLPPHDRETEESLVKAILYNDRGFEQVLEELEPEDFYVSRHQAIFRAAREVFADKGTVDLLLVREHLERAPGGLDASVLMSIERDPVVSANIPHYIDRVKKLSRNRRAQESLREALGALREGKDPEEAFIAAQAALEALGRDSRFTGALRSEAEILPDFLRELEERKERMGPYVGLRSGFDRLDEVLNGLRPGLIVLAGPPSVGKTTFLKQIADRAADLNGVPVLFVSLEQSAEELRIKTLARLSGVNSRSITRGDYLSPLEWEKVKGACSRASRFSSLAYVLEGDKDTTVDGIGACALRILREHRAETCLICIDYLQKIPVREKFGTAKDKLDFLSSELRRLARRLSSPILAVSSEARSAYNKAKMDAFKESGEIEYSADVAGVMTSEKDRREGGRTIRPVDLFILKNRNGERARISFDFCLETSAFEERGSETITSPMYEEGEED